MYNEQLEKLIELALADGELTEKEKQVLFKRAETEGIDLDEFEMVLEARVFEKTKNKTLEPIAAPKSDKFGDVKKCPSCGSIAESFSTRCTDCGYNFRNVENIKSIKEFFYDYQKIEDSIHFQEKKGLQAFFNTEDIDTKKKVAVYLKKKEFIMHFPIPNSKEDILEFLTLAVPLASPAKKGVFSGYKKMTNFLNHEASKNYDFLIAEVWLQKCEQIVMKSRLSMKDDRKTLEQVEYYTQKLGIK